MRKGMARRLPAALLSLALAAGCIPAAWAADGFVPADGAAIRTGTILDGEESCPGRQFLDLSGSGWYHEYTDYVIEEGLMNGVSATAFAPDGELTRGMLVTILYRMADKPAASSGGAFTDTDSGAWYAEAVSWASENELVTGYGDGRFGPDDPITRQELAAVLWRFAKYRGYDVRANGTVMPDFTDRDRIASWAGEAVSWAYSRGILTGKNGNSLDPTGRATRAEAAAMLTRFAKLPKGSGETM